LFEAREVDYVLACGSQFTLHLTLPSGREASRNLNFECVFEIWAFLARFSLWLQACRGYGCFFTKKATFWLVVCSFDVTLVPEKDILKIWDLSHRRSFCISSKQVSQKKSSLFH